jgi:uncharacterized protein
MPDNDKFYQQGLRFECQGSGKCCTSHGEFGFVFLTLDDRRRLAKNLGLSTAQFTRKYCTYNEEQTAWHLYERADNPDCLFLKNKQCSVYDGRPTQCRTWPFWPEVMTAKNWSEEVASFCPGVGRGRIWSAKEIEEVMAEDSENAKKFGT